MRSKLFVEAVLLAQTAFSVPPDCSTMRFPFFGPAPFTGRDHGPWSMHQRGYENGVSK